MYSKIKILGHPVHPMLVSFPIAFYTGSLVAYIVYGIVGNPFWFRLAFVVNAAGVAMALLAAVPGFLDWLLGIPNGSKAKTHGLMHMGLNVSALVLFAILAGLNAGRWDAAQPPATLSIILSAIGVLCTIGAGYLGWTLVQTHHVGIQFTPDVESCVKEKSVGGRSDISMKRAA